MTIPNRTVAITGVFAKEASTTIPSSPVSGVSYRDTSMTKEDVEEGWPYKSVVDSASFNQALFQYATISSLIEKYGFLPWSNLTDYEAGSLCLGSNGTIYQAVQATGPSTTAYDPVNDSTGTYWKDFVGNTYVTLSTAQTVTGNKTFSGQVSFTDATTKANITGFGMPDYTAAVSMPSGSQTSSTNGFIIFAFPGRAVGYFTIGNYSQSFDYNYNYTQPSWCCFPIKKGQTWDSGGVYVTFVPCIGG